MNIGGHGRYRRMSNVGANMLGANLKGYNVHGANMLGANLKGSNVPGADMSGTDVSGANLTPFFSKYIPKLPFLAQEAQMNFF
jgi:uncharacterized protein YjbI with pentapeptide repeats